VDRHWIVFVGRNNLVYSRSEDRKKYCIKKTARSSGRLFKF
jgi:hypothetical protein